jgi:glycosyltransferase involved in cell wall biosynthesis
MEESTLPLVTTVIPTRWRAELVTRAVRSALVQTYPNVEVVVVIDGPDALTAESLEALGELRLRVIALVENVGGSEARNIGVREARGSWIALLDDDDEWMPEKLARQMMMVPDTLVTQHFLVTCRRLERQPGHPDVLAPRRNPCVGEDVSEYMFYSVDGKKHASGPQTSGFLGTRQLFLDLPFSKGLKCHQDWDWYLRAMSNDRTVAVSMDEPLYIMHVDPCRQRVTEIARWELSVEWAESRRMMFTKRAYMSFLINECMYRCEETTNRMRIFLALLSRSRGCGSLRVRDAAAVVKWYIFKPSTRLRLVHWCQRIPKQLRNSVARIWTMGSASTKQEVRGWIVGEK